MFYVYLLFSRHDVNQRYIGRTEDIQQRLAVHNSGGSLHTAKYKPWELSAYFAFKDEYKAIMFEKYLKSGSGRSFANRHFW
jgi:predicted GIY-YIG superfamily endonuclease